MFIFSLDGNTQKNWICKIEFDEIYLWKLNLGFKMVKNEKKNNSQKIKYQSTICVLNGFGFKFRHLCLSKNNNNKMISLWWYQIKLW